MNSATKQILAVIVPAVLVAGGELFYLTTRDPKPAAAAPVARTAEASMVPAAASPRGAKVDPVQIVREAAVFDAPPVEEMVTDENRPAPSPASAPVAAAATAPAAPAVAPAVAPAAQMETAPVSQLKPVKKAPDHPSPRPMVPVGAPQLAGQNTTPSTPGSTPVPPQVSHSISAYDNVVAPAPVPAPQKPNGGVSNPAQKATAVAGIAIMANASSGSTADAPAQVSEEPAAPPARVEKIHDALKLTRVDTSMTLKGAKLRFVTLDDESIKWLKGSFASPSGKFEIPFEARQTISGRWEFTEAFDGVQECGEWVLDHLTIRDRTGQERTIGREHPEIEPRKFNIVKCGETAAK